MEEELGAEIWVDTLTHSSVADARQNFILSACALIPDAVAWPQVFAWPRESLTGVSKSRASLNASGPCNGQTVGYVRSSANEST